MYAPDEGKKDIGHRVSGVTFVENIGHRVSAITFDSVDLELYGIDRGFTSGYYGPGFSDIFFNITGGLTVSEPAADLGIAAALLSSFRNVPIRNGHAFLGELGLGGEIRPVNNMAARLKELASMGFTHCIVPEPKKGSEWAKKDLGIKLVRCDGISRVEEFVF